MSDDDHCHMSYYVTDLPVHGVVVLVFTTHKWDVSCRSGVAQII